MAQLIPSLGAARFDTRGELRLAERLREFLEDNAWVWHNLPFGPRGRHPDFVILHPSHGILVLEVKDWRVDTIASATKAYVELITERGVVRDQSPFEQARGYMFEVMGLVKRDKHLLFQAPSPYKGHPIAPLGFGVVFTNITRRQFEQTDLADVFPSDRSIFRDEMSESVDPEGFRTRLWSMVMPRVGPALTVPQIDRLRALLFPEVRVQQIGLPFDEPDRGPADDRVLAVMDLQQEQLARSLGEGHRIVRGVAGSGKTLILAFRAEYIAKAASREVLVLCFNRAIASRLESTMQDRKVEDRVNVTTFHSWCYRQLKQYDLQSPSEREVPDYEERLAAAVRAVADGVDKGLIPGGQYDAVLIDEAHDFEPEWLAVAARMVNPATRALMVVYDDMQAIYKGRKRPVWSQLGIDAKGRTTVLKVNYRNTSQILRFARKFAADVIGAPGVAADDEDVVLVPEDGGRDGVEPVLRSCVSYEGEAHAIVEWIKERSAAGYQWGHMAVLYPEHQIGDRFAKILKAASVPIDVASENRNRLSTDRDAVRLLTMHSSKGLEFPCVAIGGLGALGRRGEPIEENVRLSYVAITRATHEALLTYSKMSPLVERLVG